VLNGSSHFCGQLRLFGRMKSNLHLKDLQIRCQLSGTRAWQNTLLQVVNFEIAGLIGFIKPQNTVIIQQTAGS
jgi:hypothetical protein